MFQADQGHVYIPPPPQEKLPPAYEKLANMPSGLTQPLGLGHIHLEVPITHRGPAELARIYGYPEWQAFCDDIPDNARVLDVGAGISTLGLAAARRRPDVHWVNADLAYDRQNIREALETETPDNLELATVNTLNLTQELGEQRFDRVFSYYLLTHIRMAGRKHGLLAAKQILWAVKPEGRVTVGPVLSTYVDRDGPARDSIDVEAPRNSEELDAASHLINKAIKLWRLPVRQRIRNSHRLRIFSE